ncbi:MAGE-domain-containing protein [Laetiporus sulphureus 93-53]|uniref:MAGE-domain-containing protein n=1 Tax=Laetiporus sulphureus 93-53 TaxID=1314785 RepID=A0A165B2A3_9APHY|nr:MAGE-domain-containing protein [Laetiporus sulphureus 93-53]KZT00092.1 MAGE-domain-containing protein [Laetiporus sulphureus 93-53]
MARKPPSQPQPSQSQRRRHRRRDDDEEEDNNARVQSDAEEAADGVDEDMEVDVAQNELERKANDLVRLALFTESKRVPLKRDEISKKVLGSNTRSFNLVLARAQDILRKTFGMELHELQTRGAKLEKDKDANSKESELLKNTGVRKRAAPIGTKAYILRSVLDPAIIERACAPDADILAIEREDMANNDEVYTDEDDDGPCTRSVGSILAWERSDELGSVGVLYTILALILVDGRVMRDNDLRSLLKRLNLGHGATLPLSSRSTSTSLTVDAYLAQLLRQGYLERQRIGETKGAGKRGRVSAAAPAGDDGANAVEWRWGPRAMSEVGERAVARFVAEFMVDGPKAESEDESAGDDAERRKKVEVVMKGVERAAGGDPLQNLV